MNSKRLLAFIGFFTFLLATSPIFFDIYRTAAFNTVPHDDYASYLLALLRQGGAIPGAPYVYRIFSVAVAIPFFYLLPAYSFTNLPNLDVVYIKAIQAISFTSYISTVLAAIIIYLIARKKFLASRAASLTVGLMSFFLSPFVSQVGVDPLAILIISLLLLWLDNSLLFTLLMLISVGFNEKISILLAVVLVSRFISAIVQRRAFHHYVQLSSACLAAAIYFIVIFTLKIPGNERETNPALFLTNFQTTFGETLTLKGLFLNGLPIVILIVIAILDYRPGNQIYMQASDISGLLALLVIAFMVNLHYTAGRVVMYSYPLYLPAVARFIDDLFSDSRLVSNERAATLP